MKSRIVIADDHAMLREALVALLNAQPDMEVVGQTGNGLQVLAIAQSTSAHLVCMDVDMPGMNGLAATRALRAAMQQVKVVALSAYSDQRYVLDMLDAGATGYVTKLEAGDELLRAIRAVLRGRSYLCPDVADVMTDALRSQSDPKRLAAVLGPRERQVLTLVAAGQTSSEIAVAMGIVSSTVDVHRRNIMRKLDRHSVAELTRYVVDNERGPRGSNS